MTKRNHRDRRAAAVIFALVCLAMAAVLMAVVLRMTVMGWQAARDEGRRTQTAWLVESGLARAGARLAVDSEYTGETWKIPADVLDGRRGAVVLIEVEPVEAKPNQRVVRVRADYPEDPVDRIRKTEQLTITLQEPE